MTQKIVLIICIMVTNISASGRIDRTRENSLYSYSDIASIFHQKKRIFDSTNHTDQKKYALLYCETIHELITFMPPGNVPELGIHLKNNIQKEIETIHQKFISNQFPSPNESC